MTGRWELDTKESGGSPVDSVVAVEIKSSFSLWVLQYMVGRIYKRLCGGERKASEGSLAETVGY